MQTLPVILHEIVAEKIHPQIEDTVRRKINVFLVMLDPHFT